MAFRHPLAARYASREMLGIWSEENRYRTWRLVWVALAEAEAELGLPITDEQLAELRANIDNLNLQRAAELERELRHDVMAHVHAYGEQCPKARGIIHLGATSAYVTDNADQILIRSSLDVVLQRLARLVVALGDFALRTREVACLAFTHLQPAQPTTVGKRATLWCWDFLTDLQRLHSYRTGMMCRGAKGTTGTQASYLALFNGDHEKVRQLDDLVARKLGFQRSFPVTGQTYPRKADAKLLSLLAGLASSAHKLAVDLRLLASRREIEEPWGEKQVGSSAMPHKRNPMRSERICSLARYLLELPGTMLHTAATQWLERSLDDSAIRRIVLPEAFLAADALLRLCLTVFNGIEVNEAVIRRNLEQELPFLATELILMEAVKRGADRQETHERLRQHALAAAAEMKQSGEPPRLLERLKADPVFADLPWEKILNTANFVGRAPEQVREFVDEWVAPIREQYGIGEQTVDGEPVEI